MSAVKFIEKHNHTIFYITRRISNNKYISAKNNNISRLIKLQIIKLLFKKYQSPTAQCLYSIIGIDHLDLRDINLPENKDLFYTLNYFQSSKGPREIYGVKLPYIDYNYFNCCGVCIRESTFEKPNNEEDLESFIRAIHSLTRNVPVNVPFSDYSRVSFKSVDISKTHFHKNCILPDNKDFFQNIFLKDASETELPLECLKKIHLYNLDNVKINLNLYEWYKEYLSKTQLNLIKEKYPEQIGTNILLPEEA